MQFVRNDKLYANRLCLIAARAVHREDDLRTALHCSGGRNALLNHVALSGGGVIVAVFRRAHLQSQFLGLSLRLRVGHTEKGDHGNALRPLADGQHNAVVLFQDSTAGRARLHDLTGRELVGKRFLTCHTQVQVVLLQFDLRVLVHIAQQVRHGDLLTLCADIDLNDKVTAALHAVGRILLHDLSGLEMVVIKGSHNLDGKDTLNILSLVGLLDCGAQQVGNLIGLLLSSAAESSEDQHEDQHDHRDAAG